MPLKPKAASHPRSSSAGSRVKGLLKSLRPKQWIKNLFVVPALVFSHNLLHADKLLTTLQVFIAFCLLSSTVYLVNDVVDRERDRQHPRKRNRPIAAGLVSPALALGTAVVLAVVSLGWSFWLRPAVGLVAAVYLTQNALYSFGLKHVVLVDVFVVALGFVLRVMAGGFAIQTPISPWLLTTTILLALFLGLAKRRHEVTSLANPQSHRGILAEYPVALLDQLIGIVTACTVVVYAVYTFLISPGGALVYTVPFVLFGTFRYLYLIHRREGGGEPETLVLRDLPLLIDMLLWACVTFYIVYFYA